MGHPDISIGTVEGSIDDASDVHIANCDSDDEGPCPLVDSSSEDELEQPTFPVDSDEVPAAAVLKACQQLKRRPRFSFKDTSDKDLFESQQLGGARPPERTQVWR